MEKATPSGLIHATQVVEEWIVNELSPSFHTRSLTSIVSAYPYEDFEVVTDIFLCPYEDVPTNKAHMSIAGIDFTLSPRTTWE